MRTREVLHRAEAALDRAIPFLVVGILVAAVLFAVVGFGERNERRTADQALALATSELAAQNAALVEENLRLTAEVCDSVERTNTVLRKILLIRIIATPDDPAVPQYKAYVRDELQPVDC